MDFGLRGGQHADRPYAASLPVRVPAVQGLFPASFGLAARLALRGSLRLPPSVPAGSFHPARISPCWAPWRALSACRAGIRAGIASAQNCRAEDHPPAAVLALLLRAAVEVRSTGARGASQKKSGKCRARQKSMPKISRITAFTPGKQGANCHVQSRKGARRSQMNDDKPLILIRFAVNPAIPGLAANPQNSPYICHSLPFSARL